MNPQFCPTYHVRPKLVPVVVRPTVPVGYGSFDPPSPAPQYNIPLFPVHLSSDTVHNPTTSKTRRELEQLGSPTGDLTEMIFELAAQKNGIRIGTVPNKVATSKQGDSLEDFKKIAERNGITVCPAGAKNKAERAASSVIAGSDTNLFEADVESEMNSQLATINRFKDKAAKSGIRVQDATTDIQTKQQSTQGEDCGTMSKGNLLHKSESVPVTSMVDLENGADMSGEDLGSSKCEDSIDSNTLSNTDSNIETKTKEMKKDTFEMGNVEMSTELDSQSFDLKKSANRNAVNGMCTNVTTSESLSTANHLSKVTTSSTEDPQIAVFQEIARLKGIKVGKVPNETCLGIDTAGQVTEHIEDVEDFIDVLDLTEEDEQIARFQEMARLNGIKVGGKSGGWISADYCSESLMTDNADESSEYYTDMDLYPYEPDPQIAKFQELARLSGIRVNSSQSSSYSSVSTANSEEHLCALGDGIYPTFMAMHSVDTKGDIFEELAKRNGIKVGKKTVPSEAPVVKKSSACDCSARPLFASVCSQASTQTEVTVVVDCFSQTSEEDCGVLKQTTGVQVSATKEAFETEYLVWKLDENASEDVADLSYKELYFDERKAREELSVSLQNEKDVSASARHNHKRVMDQLKEELSSKAEENEKLKKDLKTLKKNKENEIKRITKELKCKEEELESTKATLQLKDTALEGLKSITQEQTAKIKALEEQLEETKSAPLEVHKNEDCKTGTSVKRNAEDKKDQDLRDTVRENQSDDGWTVITGKKSKSPSCKPTQNGKAQVVQHYGGIDQLFDFDLTSPPSLFRQLPVIDESGDDHATDTKDDVVYDSGLPDNPGGAKSPVDVKSPLYQAQTPAKEKPTLTQNASVSCDSSSLSQNHQQSVSNVADSNVQRPSVTGSIDHQPPQSTGHMFHPTHSNAETPSVVTSSTGEQPPQVLCPADSNAQMPSVVTSSTDQQLPHVLYSADPKQKKPSVVTSSAGQQQPHAFYPASIPGQPSFFPAITPGLVSQYLSNLQMLQQLLPPGNAPGNGVPKNSGPLRRPPGLNTEPVPEGEIPEQTPPPPTLSAGKFSSFDKLMEALHKRFPEKTRQELILYLKKAKAACGSAGFRGMQIPDVVKCVQDMVKLEGGQEAQDSQASRTVN